jgi:hypothetical protein
MPRANRQQPGGVVFHVLNRGNERRDLFDGPSDYDAFVRVLAEALRHIPVALLAYCLMPNHWHLVLRTAADGDLAVDAQTGAPLRARLTATFDGPAGTERGAKVTVVVSAQVKAFGGEVKAIAPPTGALADERKPAGPSTALEAAGLKKHGEERKTAEPEDEGD